MERDKANKSYSLPSTVGVGSRNNGQTIGVRFGDLTISNLGKIGHFKCHKTLSLNLPNVELDFDVTVDIMQVLTDISKINLMLK